MSISARSRRRCGSAGLDTIDRWLEAFTEKLDPRTLDTGVMPRRLNLIHEVDDVRLEALLQSIVREAACVAEGGVCPGERKHVRVETRAEVFEGHPQIPQTSVPAGHGRRSRHEQPVEFVEWLRAVARDPI